MYGQSVSEKQLVLEVRGKFRIACHLKRHLAPRTVGAIMRSLPLEGHAHSLGKDITYFDTRIDSGTERHRREFRKGDVAFLSSSGSVCFFLSDATCKAMTPLGRLDDIKGLEGVMSGDVLRLYEAA